MAYVAVLGYGTVGSGVVETLNTNRDTISARCGEPLDIKYVLDLRDFPGEPVQNVLVHEFNTILEDDTVKVVAEVMGGIEPAFTFTKKCLMRGKCVVTSNKELVAEHGAELLKVAAENGVNYMFEASVGGGIPIIRPLNESLAAEDIYEIKGILNGTTNYILTKMKKEGADFDDALKNAQEKGYAERKPDADVLGYDACRKIAILSSLAYGRRVDYNDIYTEGITGVTRNDLLFASKTGGVIKLVAESKKTASGFSARVCPLILPLDSPLSSVDGVFNAILVKGNIIGEVMFYGMGAGKLPTASAVVSDIIDCVKNPGKDIMHRWEADKIAPDNNEERFSKLLIRFACDGETGQINDIRSVFPECEILRHENVSGEFAAVVENVKESALSAAKTRFGETLLNAVRFEN